MNVYDYSDFFYGQDNIILDSGMTKNVFTIK